MIAGLILRYVFNYPLILVMTFAGQRRFGWFSRLCYRRMDGLIATTRTTANFLVCPADVVYHGVDLSIYYPPQDRAAERLKRKLAQKRNLGIFGRVRPQKGTGDLVAALVQVLPQFPEWGAVIVGQATEEYRIYELSLKNQLRAAGLGDRVRFTGFIREFQEIPAWYRALDLVVCASRQEGFGLPCLEAMASGCPVVATRAGAWPEIISEGEDGWLACPNDPDDLARALRTALTLNEASLTKMGQHAHDKMVRSFSIEREADGIIAVCDKLFKQYGEPPLTSVIESQQARPNLT